MKRSAVLFDFDGTITKPYLDFDAIRAEIGIQGYILEAIEKLGASSRERAEQILLRHEWQAAHAAELQENAVEVLSRCRDMGHPVGILTRNARATVGHVLQQHGIVVDAMRTREDGAIKPSPEPVFALCDELDADPRSSWVVGDFLFDILSGRSAGSKTVLMIGDDVRPDFATLADHVIRRLGDLLPLLSDGPIRE